MFYLYYFQLGISVLAKVYAEATVNVCLYLTIYIPYVIFKLYLNVICLHNKKCLPKKSVNLCQERLMIDTDLGK